MPDSTHLWMRHEARPTERRAPLTPQDAARLVEAGVRITVEESAQRAFPLADYTAAGCATAPTGSWHEQAPDEAYVLGLKELPAGPGAPALRHRHIYFGHAYKGQAGARELLARFTAGGGALLDMEYLTDEAGRRVAAFGYWAGYVGAALAVLHHRGALTAPLVPTDRPALDALLAHDLLVNTVLTTTPVPPFLTKADLDEPARRLSLVSDVTCDVTSDCNVLPVYDETTTWDAPVRTLRDGDRPLDLIAIDNLPSLLPVEAATAFSAELAPHLLRLAEWDGVWARALHSFRTAVESQEAAPFSI
ncbi:saccharopine dehydrogenase [Streptomyces katrae]|uniref:Saccharopine dehydrogenase n=1 Tax=Streptomyces katrae TaxID=68223 RepID=A0A0F4JUD8_9ACTN|nr:saccharopine dehydrogenase [Streptomyces katrae]KJY37795.1 saccharopine dehydrogenase [Streptomyces katrae]